MAISGDGGKGYGRRKPLVPNSVIESNWNTIFGIKKPIDTTELDVYNEERLVSKYDKEKLKDEKTNPGS